MPHSHPYVPTARTIPSRTTPAASTKPTDRLPTAPKPAHHAVNKPRKGHSAPPVLINGRKHARYGSDTARAKEFHTSSTNSIVKSKPVTSRSASPGSSLSATETLAHFSDSSSITATEAASPKLNGASVASRRYRFKEEFGTENAIAASSTGYPQSSKRVKDVDAFYENPFVTTTPVHERTPVRAAEQTKVKTKSSKKVARNCGPNLDFAYRNVYTAATGIGNVGSSAVSGRKGKGGRDGFEVPHVASAHVGCAVM